MTELQTIPARHGVATFVPAGQVIKIINSSGTQVVDTWAFALPKPDAKSTGNREAEQQDTKVEGKDEKPAKEDSKPSPAATPKKKKKNFDLPSQEEAERATKSAHSAAVPNGDAKGEEQEAPPKKTWSSYVPSVPSLGLVRGKKGGETSEEQQEGDDDEEAKDKTEQQKNSRTWSSYFLPGKSFGTYIPKQASDTVSQFASYHERDTSKTYLQQLQDFSQTPVGAAGLKVMTGSGYSGSLIAGYQAYNAKNAADVAQMEFMSMPHTRSATLHLQPRVNDTLVTNIREPIMTLVEDTSSGIHDTLIAACDPQRYRGLGVPKWEEHGSCAENLVLALKELNERAGLKGGKAVGADVTINNVPAPLNLFMNIPWDEEGDLGFKGPKSKAGDYVRFKAERDVVVVMSACPQDVLEINARKPTDASFLVEESEDPAAAIRRTEKKPPTSRKVSTSQASSAGVSTGGVKKNPLPSKPPPPPQKRPVPAATSQAASTKGGQKSYTPAKKTGPQPVKQAAPEAPTEAPARPMKKPIPPVRTTSSATGGDVTPKEKKKPRKLVRPQVAAGGAEG